MRFHGDKFNSTLKSTPFKSTRNPWSASANSIFFIRSNLPRRGFLVIGYLWLSLRSLTDGGASRPPPRMQPAESASNRIGRARREGERARNAGERSRKERTQGEPARGGHMKIFLGMPKTETRAGRSSLPPRPREGTPAVLCVTSEIAVISRWPPLVLLLSTTYFLPRFSLFLSPFARSRAVDRRISHVYAAFGRRDFFSFQEPGRARFLYCRSVRQKGKKFRLSRRYRRIRPWRWVPWEPVGISGSFVRPLRSTSTLSGAHCRRGIARKSVYS